MGQMNMDFTGKKIFITGGSRGIGAGICKAFEKFGGEITAPARSCMDLSSEESIQSFLQKSSEVKYDVFVHCAGINRLAGIEEIDAGLMKEVYFVNCVAPVMLARAFVPGMKANGYGRIVFLSSLYATVSRERRLAYSASKNALNGIMKSMAIELAADNILVNCVAPGYVMTEMTRHNLSEKEISDIKKSIPTGRLQTVEEIADVVLFMCSDLNRSITGQLLTVDGGFTCR